MKFKGPQPMGHERQIMRSDNLKPHIITPENAERIADWLHTRGGTDIWRSIFLGILLVPDAILFDHAPAFPAG